VTPVVLLNGEGGDSERPEKTSWKETGNRSISRLSEVLVHVILALVSF